MPSDIDGFKQLSRQLRELGAAPAGKVVRRAALSAMLPALREAQSRAPVGQPPYEGKDPYPVRTYKGRLRTPGFAKRNVSRKAVLHDEGGVSVMLGVKPEAFYAIQFHEFGTSSIPRNPWLEPAFRASLPAVNARFRARLKQILDKAR